MISNRILQSGLTAALLLGAFPAIGEACRLGPPDDRGRSFPRYAVGTPAGIVIVDGSSRREVPDTADVLFFAWDRDGASFVAALESMLVRIAVLDGSRETLVSDLTRVRFLDVDMATGRIAFSRGSADPSRGWEVWVCETDGAGPRSLGPGYGPSFAPDGQVWFEDYTDGGAAIFSVDPEGASPRAAIFADDVSRYTVECSEDAGFVSWSEQGRLQLRDESGQTRSPSPDTGAYDRFPSFAPDGRHVLFFRSVEGKESIVACDLESLATWTLEILAPGHLARFAPAAPRSAADFIQCSQHNAALPLTQRTGMDAVLDHPRALWIERGAARVLGSSDPQEDGPWFQNGVRWLLPAEADAIASLRGGDLFLPDLASLDLATAERLGAWRGGALWLDGLVRLSPEVLDALLRERRSLVSFGGLSTLDRDLAVRLASVNGSVHLDGVSVLDDVVAEVLATWRGNGERFVLSLDGLIDPDPALVRVLGASRGWGLSFGGIRQLTPAMLDALAVYRGALIDLDGVTSLDDEAVSGLLELEAKWIELRGLRSLGGGQRARLEVSEAPIFVLPPEAREA